VSRPRPHIPEPLRKLARVAKEAGWTITRTRGDHLRWRHPGGATVITPSTPNGGNRSIRNARADLKRAGLDDESKPGDTRGH
jgi:predicted RNA binding protein YcfA (HicA-like mRNA interferase family)